ncbi:MAG: hypothetical protein LBC98_04390 [Prevotellaceae bacterium]|nr:hypothetical protein [Prevotellaceae bacterium]
MKKSVMILAILFMAQTAAQSQTDLNMLNTKNGGTLFKSWIYVDNQNNFAGASFVTAEDFSDTIVIPAAAGWTNKIAATPETAIIAYLKGDTRTRYTKSN